MNLKKEMLWELHDAWYRCIWYQAWIKEGSLDLAAYCTRKLNEVWRLREEMATKKQASPVKKMPVSDIKWVNRNLDEREKADHDRANYTDEGIFIDLCTLTLQGYNFSLKWDGYSSCFQAALIPYNEQDVNYGFGLSARAATPKRAVSLLLYKHFRVLEQNWVKAYVPAQTSFEG